LIHFPNFNPPPSLHPLLHLFEEMPLDSSLEESIIKEFQRRSIDPLPLMLYKKEFLKTILTDPNSPYSFRLFIPELSSVPLQPVNLYLVPYSHLSFINKDVSMYIDSPNHSYLVKFATISLTSFCSYLGHLIYPHLTNESLRNNLKNFIQYYFKGLKSPPSSSPPLSSFCLAPLPHRDNLEMTILRYLKDRIKALFILSRSINGDFLDLESVTKLTKFVYDSAIPSLNTNQLPVPSLSDILLDLYLSFPPSLPTT